MESYVVRIYRRDPNEPLKLVGMVEDVETKATRIFSHAGELVDILCPESDSSAWDSDIIGRLNRRNIFLYF